MNTPSILQSLLGDDAAIPPAVIRCQQRIGELDAWAQFSRNTTATSCQDAAERRNRLGHRGIPLRDELKSFLGECDTGSVFLAHCRGDRELDLDKVLQALGWSGAIRRASAETASALGTAYGIVNPFTVPADVVQVFDTELKVPLGVPGTIMTNAGDYTWAIEFDPSEVVDRMPGARWADIISNTDLPNRTSGVGDKAIGILTGNPCDSGLELCSSINSHLRVLMGRHSLGDVSMPRIVLVSSPQIGISMEMDRRTEPLRRALLAAMDELCAMGASIIGHPAHTTHYFADDLAARAGRHGAQFISMSAATAEKIQQLEITEIALLGTRFVTDSQSPWSVYNAAFRDLTVHRPSPAGWKKVHDLGYEVQQNGLTPLSFNWMRDLLRDEVPKTCKNVVLAMTEFAPVARQLRNRGRHGKTLIEPIDIYGEAIARAFLASRNLEGLPSMNAAYPADAVEKVGEHVVDLP